jgi:uncharacterized coiled-coil protein SlyX
MTNILDELDEVLAELKRCVDRNRNKVQHEEKEREIEPYISRSRTFNFSKGRSGSS